MASPTFPNLEGLEKLARRDGVDIRPILVRVLTDLYVQKPAHSLEEQRHYTELVLRLIDVVDVSTRAVVAKKLAAYEAAPADVIRRLARDVLEVAEPVLKHSNCLTGVDLLAIISEFGHRYAAVIGERAAFRAPRPATPGDAVALDRSPAAPTGSSTAAPPTNGASGGSIVASTEGRPAGRAHRPMPDGFDDDMRLGELFLAAGSKQRRLLLASLDVRRVNMAARRDEASTDTIRRLEQAALRRNAEEFVREIEAALDLSREHAERIVHDPTGEPLLVAAKALGVAPNVLLRILLFLNPAIGQSVEQVFDLVKCYEGFGPAAAAQVIASLRRRPAAQRATHQPVLWNDEAEGARRGKAEIVRRQASGPVRTQVDRHPGSGIPNRRQGTT